MRLSLVTYLLTFTIFECKAAITRIVVPNNNNKYLNYPPYAGIAQNGNNVVPIPPGDGTTANGNYQCVPSGTCPDGGGGGGGGDDEIDIRIVTPVSVRLQTHFFKVFYPFQDRDKHKI